MTGKMIVLSGVVAGGAAGGPMVKMTSADQIAANIPALAYVISPSTLKVGADGLLTGRDRASGKLLTAGGSSANLLTVALMGGKPAICNSGSALVASCLGLPAGTATPSYTTVQAVYLGDATLNTATGSLNPIIVMTTSSYIASPLRLYGKGTTPGDPTYKGQFVGGGSTASAPWARLNAPTVKGWCILTACYDDVTKQTTITLNGTDSSTVTKTVGLTVDSASYWAVGYPYSGSALLDSGIGDTYIFNESLQSTDYGKGRLAALVASMKTAYGVA
uniref:Uncharacterized protein n=1 Tax=Myoviridae sp. ctdyF5 TaxID=2825144 RepID=A0A8S5U7M9_9CAUD|nr:MAG TPA: hypothetical protein [Myoviridae sp. ctdyF5]